MAAEESLRNLKNCTVFWISAARRGFEKIEAGVGDIVVSVGFHSTLTLHTKLHLLIGSTFLSTPGYVAPLGLFWWVWVAF